MIFPQGVPPVDLSAFAIKKGRKNSGPMKVALPALTLMVQWAQIVLSRGLKGPSPKTLRPPIRTPMEHDRSAAFPPRIVKERIQNTPILVSRCVPRLCEDP
jgi:hypothetical protein